MLDLLIEIVQSVDFRLLGLPAPPPSKLVIADTRDFPGPISAYLSLLPADLIALLRRFLLEADIYFTTPAAAAEIDTRVLHTLGPALAAGDRPVVVGHRSEEHTSELQSLMRLSYAVFCMNKTKRDTYITDLTTQPQILHNP